MLLTVGSDTRLFTTAGMNYIDLNGEVTNLINNRTDQKTVSYFAFSFLPIVILMFPALHMHASGWTNEQSICT